jgi:glycosyltransferase involved in cell wall biosynthesis
MSATVHLSVVIPIFNEAENIPILYQRLTKVVQDLCNGLLSGDLSYELIFIDDGSQDQSRNLLQEIITQDHHTRLLGFSRNFGHQVAVTAGLNHAHGAVTIIMDSDLQDPPELIPQLYQQWQEGFKIVYAQRAKRENEPLSKILFAFVYYRLLNHLSEIPIPVDTGDFCLLDRQVVETLNRLPERHRYIRGLRSWTGFKQTEVIFERPNRAAGEPKYTVMKSLALALDGLVSFSKVPLRLATWLGFFAGIFAFGMASLVIYWRFFTSSPLVGSATILVGLFFLGAVQLITIGILGEYIGRIYEEVKQRPLYILDVMAGFEPRSFDSRSDLKLNPQNITKITNIKNITDFTEIKNTEGEAKV